jgi:hypothetical protein
MEYGGTAHNRTVYASPPVGCSGYEKPQSGYALCAVFLRHIWGRGRCYANAYPGRQNVIYIRQAMILSIPYWDLLLYLITG